MASETLIQSFGGQVGIGTTTMDAGYKLNVYGGDTELEDLEMDAPSGSTYLMIGTSLYSHLPSGSIMVWSGPQGEIPPGWSEYTDLSARFALGLSPSYSLGDTGGSVNLSITTEQLPPHTHPHPGVSAFYGHDHNVTVRRTCSTAYFTGITGADINIPSYNWTYTETSSSATMPDHNHPGYTGYNGPGGSTNILPPYMALYFIIKD